MSEFYPGMRATIKNPENAQEIIRAEIIEVLTAVEIARNSRESASVETLQADMDSLGVKSCLMMRTLDHPRAFLIEHLQDGRFRHFYSHEILEIEIWTPEMKEAVQ